MVAALLIASPAWAAGGESLFWPDFIHVFFSESLSVTGPAPGFQLPGMKEKSQETLTTARLILEGGAAEWHYDIHAVQAWRARAGTPYTAAPAAIERSAIFNQAQRRDDTSRADFGLDRFSVRHSAGAVDIIAGRQAINLATCYHFTPNDFFAPFSFNSFYRAYKPGVDALRMEARLDNLTQASLMAVAGYERDLENPGSFERSPDGGLASYLGRLSHAFQNLEVVLLGGSLRGEMVAGGAVQGETVFNIGYRAEGHYKTTGSTGYGAVSAQLERRFENTLILRGEYFLNGAGAASPALYDLDKPYPAREYAGLGASYEFTPLLTGETVGVINFGDGSGIISATLVYSVGDESDLAFSGYVPWGTEPGMEGVQSQFGSLPEGVSMELRAFF